MRRAEPSTKMPWCLVKDFKKCQLPPCLKRLIDELKKKAKDKCSMYSTTPVPDTGSSDEVEVDVCKPSSVCDIEAAFKCVDTMTEISLNDTNLCIDLEKTKKCSLDNVASCSSIQRALTISYFESTLRNVVTACKDSVTVDLNVPVDVYSSTAICISNFMKPLEVAMNSTHFVESRCAAAYEFKACQKNLPNLMYSFLLNNSLQLANKIAEVCNTSQDAGSNGQREKRDASCSIDVKAELTWKMIFFINFIPLHSRSRRCIQASKAYQVLSKYLSSDCSVSMDVTMKTILTVMLETGKQLFSQYCVEVEYLPASCRPDLFASCMQPFKSASLFSSTPSDTLCRATQASLKCLKKFSTGCPAKRGAVVHTLWQTVRAAVGNKCPDLTLGLFCPDTYPSLTNSFPCNMDNALQCLPSEGDLRTMNKLHPEFCIKLERDLECANRSVEGCLPSQIKKAQESVDSITTLLPSNCKLKSTLTNYSTVCAAQVPCSKMEAMECFALKDKDPITCLVVSRVRSCLDASLTVCDDDTEVVNIVSGLFLTRFQPKALNGCVAPFKGLLTKTSKTYDCTDQFISSFQTALKEKRTQHAVCVTFQQYKSCLMSASSNSVNLASLLKPVIDMDDINSTFCQADGVNASTAQVSTACDLDTASFCLVQEITWTMNRHVLPTSNRQNFCQKWHGQETRTCVMKVASKCNTGIQTFLEKMVTLSNRLVLLSGVCDTISTCNAQEAIYHINQLNVAIVANVVDNDRTKICLKKQKTENVVGMFTDTCSAEQKKQVADQLSRVILQIEGEDCDDIIQSLHRLSPICPNLPSDQRRCSFGAAFTCIINYHTELLEKDESSLIFYDRCLSLENTIRCAALNTSSCSKEDSDLQDVISGLDKLRDAAGNRCHWLSPDLCTRTPPCPVQYAKCDVKLQISLLNNPLTDVCKFIKVAKACVEEHTVTCTPAQKELANVNVQRRLEDLSIPDLKCDGTGVAPCLFKARAAAWQVLAESDVVNVTTACEAATDASECLSDRTGSLTDVTDRQNEVIEVAGDVKTIVSKWCTSPGSVKPCGHALARVINTINDMTISVATTTMDSDALCSTRQAVLAETAEVRKLYQDICTFSDLSAVEDRLKTAFSKDCQSDRTVVCVEASKAAEKCLNDAVSTSNSCSELNSVLVCVAPAVGVCNEATYKPYVDRLTELFNKSVGCDRPPIIGLTTPTTRALYLSEQGGTVDIDFKFVENYSAYTAGAKRQVRVRAEVSNDEPPTCLGDDSEISQVSVLYEGTEMCGVRLGEGADWNTAQTIRLVANQDRREDGVQKAHVTLYVDVYDYDQATDSWNQTDVSYKLAEYELSIDDNDVDAVCSSLGPHTETFDTTTFRNDQAGQFLLYRNTFVATAVTVSLQQCTLYAATCPCAVDVYAGSTHVQFDQCKRIGQTSAPADMTVSMESVGQKDDLSVYKHSSLKTYFVVLPTGTVVTIRNNKNRDSAAVWISASSFDFGKTEGLCGLFDNNAYNDLILPSGQRYIMKASDVLFSIPSLKDFVNKWNVSQLSRANIISGQASTIMTSSCSCLNSNPSANQCSAISKVATCDYVQGMDITDLLRKAAAQTAANTRRKRSTVEDDVDYAISFAQNVSWPTSANWTEEQAREHCEILLEERENLRYCDRAVLEANGTYSYADLIDTCVDNIRVAYSTLNGTFTASQAVEKCRSLFLHNITYQNSVRSTVLTFLDNTCDHNCNDNGDCEMGVCSCYPSYVGGNCSHKRTDLPRPYNTHLIQNGLCEVTSKDRCDDVFITGEGFIESSYLSCHMQSVQVLSSGFHSPVGLPRKVSATLMTANMVHCQITRSNSAEQTLLIGVSNNGIDPTVSMLFTAYDPRCYACDPDTHLCKHIATATCEIKGQCFMPEDISDDNICLICDPLQSETKWSIRNLPECEKFRDDKDDDDSTEVSALLIAILVVGACLLVVGIIIVAVCIIKKRQRGNTGRDHEFGNNPPSYDNHAYSSQGDMQFLSSKSMEPQEFFNQSSIHKRTVTRESAFSSSSARTESQ